MRAFTAMQVMRAFICVVGGAYASSSIGADGATEPLWVQFVEKFQRVFATEEEELLRRDIFQDNLRRIERMQAVSTEVQYSHMSPFADWSRQEFLALNSMTPQPIVAAEQLPLLDTAGLPESFDWRESGCVNSPQNQGKCGDCWAFSTVANIEGVNCVSGAKRLVKLSEQQLTDCSRSTGNAGCKNGYPMDAFRDMIKSKYGLMSEADYPFSSLSGTSGSCKAVTAKEFVFIKGWANVSTDEGQIAAALMKYGVLSMAINAGVDGMEFYKSGINAPKEWECPANRINHAVNLVGFGVENGTKYWTIRNSYGPDWGEKGYYRIARGACGVPNRNYQCCGLNTMVTTAIMDSPAPEMLV